MLLHGGVVLGRVQQLLHHTLNLAQRGVAAHSVGSGMARWQIGKCVRVQRAHTRLYQGRCLHVPHFLDGSALSTGMATHTCFGDRNQRIVTAIESEQTECQNQVADLDAYI